MNNASIYVLVDPRDGDVRYVGWTVRSLRQRLGSHRRDKRKSHRTSWIRGLLLQGQEPIIRLVQHVLVQDVQTAERYWIAWFKSVGCLLVNSTDGGEGNVGWHMSEETRRKTSDAKLGKKLSQATRDRMSAGHTGRRHSNETRKKIGDAHRGRKAKYSQKGRVMSDSARANMKAAKQNISEATRRKIEAAGLPDILRTRLALGR